MTGRRGAVQPWEVCGWVDNGAVTCLVLVYAHGPEEHPEPGLSIMPRVGVPASLWPPFTAADLAPLWLHGHRRAGRLVSLDEAISGTFAIAYWVPVKRIPDAGAGLIAVAEPLTPPAASWTLPRGVYVYHRAQTPDARMPSLDAALNHPDRIDLGLRLAATTRRKASVLCAREEPMP
jgi:hypothetical protein